MQSVSQRLIRKTPIVSSPAKPSRPNRGAFSLIELMIVITIIAILMSLLLVGVRGAMGTARNATVTVEFKNIEKGIADFKAKFGAEPPSRILLCEDVNDWTTPTGTYPDGFSAVDISRSRALLRQIWPDFDLVAAADNSDDRDINGDGDDDDFIGLTGAECLVFFLGGVPEQTGNTETPWELQGFSANPESPFSRGGARVGPFHDFDAGRLRNLSEDSANPVSMPEYLDSLPGQRSPILYASSYGGKGYRNADLWLDVPPGPGPVPVTYNAYNRYATVPTGFAWYYRRYTGGAPATVAAFTDAPAFNPKTFQLISPGSDGEYGLGGMLNTGMELGEAIRKEPTPAPWSPPTTYDNSARAYERDNITNFKGGTIN